MQWKHTMKLTTISTLFIMLFSAVIYAQGQAVLTDSFDIGMPSKTISISDKMLADGRTAAVKNAEVLFRQTDDPVVGNPNGAITFVAFLDYQCPISEKMDPIIQTLIKINPDLRVVYKELPLRGEKSIYAAKAALAAKQQGKYLPLHTALMRAGANINDAKVLAIAKEQGLDMQKLKSAMNDPAIMTQINNIHYLAREIGIVGTPTLFFSKTNTSANTSSDAVLFMMGKFDQADLQQAIDYIRQQQ